MTELSETQSVVTATEQPFRMQDRRSPVMSCSRRDCRTSLKPPPRDPASSGHFPTPRLELLTCSAPMIVRPLIARHPPAAVPATLPWYQVPGIGPLPRASCRSHSSGASMRRPCPQRRTQRPPGPGAPGDCGASRGCARLRRRPVLKGKGRTKGGRRDSRGRLSRETPGRSVSVGLFLRGSAGSRPPDVGAVFCRCPPRYRPAPDFGPVLQLPPRTPGADGAAGQSREMRGQLKLPGPGIFGRTGRPSVGRHTRDPRVEKVQLPRVS